MGQRVHEAFQCRSDGLTPEVQSLRLSSGIAELEERESMQMRPRAYLTFLSLLFMYIGIGCMLYPLCDVLDIIGLPTAPCFVLVVFGSFFASFCVLTFILFLAWSCTR